MRITTIAATAEIYARSCRTLDLCVGLIYVGAMIIAPVAAWSSRKPLGRYGAGKGVLYLQVIFLSSLCMLMGPHLVDAQWAIVGPLPGSTSDYERIATMDNWTTIRGYKDPPGMQTSVCLVRV
jgi:hypothetical protein